MACINLHQVVVLFGRYSEGVGMGQPSSLNMIQKYLYLIGEHLKLESVY